MAYVRKYKRGNLIKTMAKLSKELDSQKYVFYNARPCNPGWLRSMTYNTLCCLISGKILFTAKENKKCPK